MMKDQETTIGVDVAKHKLDVCVLPDGEYAQFDNDENGISQIMVLIKKSNPTLVVFEPSGGYERLLQQTLVRKKLPYAKVNARMVRDFARCTGRIAKTDAIDADVLAQYGAVIRPESKVAISEEEAHLSALIKRRRQLVDDLVREKNRLEKKPPFLVVKSIKKHIKFLEKEIGTFDEEMAKHIKSSEILAKKTEMLTAIRGIGKNTAAVLLADMPELGKIGSRPIASLAGLAPHNRDSGMMRGKRMVSGGRSTVRRALYMATLTAIRQEGFVRDFYIHLTNQGKPAKVAMTAAMRKMLVRVNAKIRDEFYA
ncbi:IS110 family transposase [Ekhidna sp.]|jgi:transposase|uniref:IS110 family transposase n=1 Tax=Ekhidna sp. TaxID=2608089 RepID=UPI0032ED111C